MLLPHELIDAIWRAGDYQVSWAKNTVIWCHPTIGSMISVCSSLHNLPSMFKITQASMIPSWSLPVLKIDDGPPQQNSDEGVLGSLLKTGRVAKPPLLTWWINLSIQLFGLKQVMCSFPRIDCFPSFCFDRFWSKFLVIDYTILVI